MGITRIYFVHLSSPSSTLQEIRNKELLKMKWTFTIYTELHIIMIKRLGQARDNELHAIFIQRLGQT